MEEQVRRNRLEEIDRLLMDLAIGGGTVDTDNEVTINMEMVNGEEVMTGGTRRSHKKAVMSDKALLLQMKRELEDNQIGGSQDWC